MNRIDDEVLMAFADGELDPEHRRAVEAALAADPELRARLDRHRRLRERISGRYAPIAEEAVPERFAALLAAGAAAPEGRLVDLAEARRKRARGAWPSLVALAATLVLGLFAGTMIPRSGTGPLRIEGGTMMAQGRLEAALETRLASEPEARGGARIGITFAAADGRICRTFETAALGGLACRGEAGWQIVTAVGAPGEAAGEYRQAASGNRLVMEAAQEMMAGETFGPDAERRARDSGWRNNARRD